MQLEILLMNKKFAEQEMEIKTLKSQITQLERGMIIGFLEADVDLFISGHTRSRTTRLARVLKASECLGQPIIKGKFKWHHFQGFYPAHKTKYFGKLFLYLYTVGPQPPTQHEYQ